jgi:hypothetical protein
MTTKRFEGWMIIAVSLAASGCDDNALGPEGLAAHDEGRFELRDGGDLTGPDKLNTSFLGVDETLPFNNLPLVPGGQPGVELVEIQSKRCIDPTGSLLHGDFSTYPVSPDVEVTVSPKGVLGAITLARTTNPAATCTVEGDLWEDTKWEVRVPTAAGVVATDLWLVDAGFDERGVILYDWRVNRSRVQGQMVQTPVYAPLCAEDQATGVDPALRYHAYLVPDLQVDPSSGDFSYSPPGDSTFLACISGAAGKVIKYGYHPWKLGEEVHELGTRMLRADYCGDGVSHTMVGTPIRLQDVLEVWPDTAPTGVYQVEAAWSTSTGAALCLTDPRLDGIAVACASGPLPVCSEDHLDDADIVTWVH